MFPRILTWGIFASATAALSSFDDWPHLRVTLNDVSIHARYYGSGPPVVLIHGNSQFSLTWRTIGPMQHYTVIAPDNRGASDSSIPSDGKLHRRRQRRRYQRSLGFLEHYRDVCILP